MSTVRNTATSVVIKVRMGSGNTWQARGGRRGFKRVASSTSDAWSAARCCAAKVLYCREDAVHLQVLTEPRSDQPGEFRASIKEAQP